MYDHETWIERLPADAALFVRELARQPNYPRELAKFSGARRRLKPDEGGVAEMIADQAWRLAPHDVQVRQEVRWYLQLCVPAWHFDMVNDTARNAVYAEALRRHVKPGMIVFEVGTGTGLLAMLAARAGAAHVYTCEREPLLADAARENIARNGLADRVTVIGKSSELVEVGVDLPRPADLFVSELIDNALLGECTLDITQDVRARLLAPGAILLPDQIAMRGTVVGGPEWTREFRTQGACGFDLSALDRFAPDCQPAPSGLGFDLADEVTALHFDMTADNAPEEKTVTITARKSGTADAFLTWIWLRFGPGLEFDNRPPKRTCWPAFLHSFPRSIAVAPGDEIAIRVGHDRKSVYIRPE